MLVCLSVIIIRNSNYLYWANPSTSWVSQEQPAPRPPMIHKNHVKMFSTLSRRSEVKRYNKHKIQRPLQDNYEISIWELALNTVAVLPGQHCMYIIYVFMSYYTFYVLFTGLLVSYVAFRKLPKTLQKFPFNILCLPCDILETRQRKSQCRRVDCASILLSFSCRHQISTFRNLML